MKKVYILIVIIFFPITTKAQDQQLDILKNNWINYLLMQEENLATLPYFYNINPDGTWSDIDYTNKVRGNWPLREHLYRTVDMAIAYQKKGNKHYKNQTLYNNVHLAYNWWVNHDIINPNWWYPQIGVPQNIGLIMLLMENSINEKQWQKGITIMNRVVFGNLTGQNKVWVSSNIILRSILKHDLDLVAQATKNIRNEMQIANNEEGLQPDYSFHQHGRQLQFGNYGLHFLEDQVKWMFILKNSEYDYTQEQIDLMRNYFTQGQRWVIWKGVYDINSSGRQLFLNEQLKKYKRLCKASSEMKKIDPNHADLYQSICDENKLNGVKHFPFSELMIQHTPQYMVSIRMVSSRVKGSESGNGENLSGYYLADGAMYIMKTGKEYLNIFPYWNWRKIPGTTAVQDTTKLPQLDWYSYHIPSHFTGGLTHNNKAITSMQYDRDGVTANKSYFLFPEFTVCLGAGINGQNNQHLQTTIEQCFSTTPIYTNDDDILQFEDSETKQSNAHSFWHQGTGYIINEGHNITVSLENKLANWNQVDNSSSEKEEKATKSVFTLGIDHGKNVKNDKYAYAVFPNMDKAKLRKTYKDQPYQILSNTENIQAVHFNNDTAMVFHKSDSININDKIELTSSVPAILMCKENQKQLSITVSDPTQKLKSGQITITRTGKSGVETFVKTIDFPIGIKKGTPVTIEISLK
ncbi:polysaccharide lyase family 8 super-sandwich domain-containing protein [Algibacter pacificus]|uniref:polysaccharide lyase family 8 super-sandwich domain-containing protein n=1 Tax=Algibacter pacificus TaxID=2599389 RepID=UPI00165056ED|nr:polysaccharide lyase family 8 super-sandwich domain-containing protein [Algibacter pacificus]